MKTKKNARVNLEKKRNFFFLVGLTVTLGATLMAFEWRTDSQELMAFNHVWDPIEVEMTPLDRVPEPPKPKIKKPKVLDFEIIDDKEEDIPIEDIDLFDTEDIGDGVDEVDLPDEVSDEPIPFVLIEAKPYFKGGDEALMHFFAKSTKYPKEARELGISGKVFVSFVISKTGEIVDVKIERGVDPYLDKEALRVVNSMPNWVPGKQRGKPVNVGRVLPINFKFH